MKKGGTQIRTGDGSFAGFCLTTWPCHRKGLLIADPVYMVKEIRIYFHLGGVLQQIF
jgi:hypothetical protein